MDSATTSVLPNPLFWRNKRVVVTGHTGFKGGWLSIWLNRLGAKVRGLALEPMTKPSLFCKACIGDLVDSKIADIRDKELVRKLILEFDAELILHLAAQPLVLMSYSDPITTIETNVMGTVNVLDAARAAKSTRIVLVVTTDKVYLNEEDGTPFHESDTLGGKDPYSASKAAAEIIVAAYRDSFFAQAGIALSSARAGNVIGGGDWADNRLIPDAVRAWSANSPLVIRHPHSVRPWNHVLEALAGYLVLCEKMWEQPGFSSAWNFGPARTEANTVATIVEMAQQAYGQGEFARCSDNEGPNESRWLTLDTTKAERELGISTRWSVREAVGRTMQWYRREVEGVSAFALCCQDIDNYMSS